MHFSYQINEEGFLGRIRKAALMPLSNLFVEKKAMNSGPRRSFAPLLFASALLCSVGQGPDSCKPHSHPPLPAGFWSSSSSGRIWQKTGGGRTGETGCFLAPHSLYSGQHFHHGRDSFVVPYPSGWLCPWALVRPPPLLGSPLSSSFLPQLSSELPHRPVYLSLFFNFYFWPRCVACRILVP